MLQMHQPAERILISYHMVLHLVLAFSQIKKELTKHVFFKVQIGEKSFRLAVNI